MSELFENCESDFNKIVNQIERMIANAPNLQPVLLWNNLDDYDNQNNKQQQLLDKKDKALIDIKYEFNEADQQFFFNANSNKYLICKTDKVNGNRNQLITSSHQITIATKNLRNRILQIFYQIKKYRNEWDNLRKRYVKIEENHNDDKRRESLMDQKIELQTTQSNGKERFIKTGAMMSDGSYKLKGALREIYQIEDQANNIAVNIYNQNKQLDNMIQDNIEISGNLSDSNRLLDRMKRNIRRNKFVLCLVSFIIVIAIIIILWVKF